MTQTSAPWDGILLGDAADAPYSADEWATLWKAQRGVGTEYPNYGVFAGTESSGQLPLEVLATNPVSTNVEVQIGAAMVNGYVYRNTAVETLAVAANASGNPRIDTVILRLDYVARTIRLVVKQGTPAGSPVAPTLTQNASFWEIPLADIAVANGFVTLAQSTITYRARFVHTVDAGWVPYAYPINFAHDVSYDAAQITLTPAEAIAVPVIIAGNMLVSQVQIRVPLMAAYSVQCGLYKQKTNDGLTAENTLHRIGQLFVQSGATVGNTFIGPANSTGTPVYISPGLYWIVIQNTHGANNFLLSVNNSGTFQTLSQARRKTITNPMPAALDFSTGWSALGGMCGFRLRGIVFGEAGGY